MSKHLILYLFLLSSIQVMAETSDAFHLIEALYIDGIIDTSYLKQHRLEIRTSSLLTVLLNKEDVQNSINYRIISEEGDIGGYVRETYTSLELPVIFFQTLQKGKYQLEVFTCDGDIVQEKATLEVQVKSAFFDHWTFLILLIFYLLLLFGGAIYIIILTNNRNRKKVNDLRGDWAAKLHSKVGADLSAVKMSLGTLQRKMIAATPQNIDRVLKIEKDVEDIGEQLRFIFEVINPTKDSLEITIKEVLKFAHKATGLKDIQLKVENTLDYQLVRKYNIGRVNKLQLALMEVLNNCVKYANAKNVLIRIKQIPQAIRFDIKDDGIGFDASQQPSGNGLEELKGYQKEGIMDIEYDTSPDEGTHVKIIFPLF